MSNSTKETEVAAVRTDSKAIYQFNEILSGKFTLGRGYISKKTERPQRQFTISSV